MKKKKEMHKWPQNLRQMLTCVMDGSAKFLKFYLNGL